MMAAGYEARARVTADMSGFVSAARSASSAANAMAASVRALNTELRNTQQAAAQSAAAARPFTQATRQSTSASREQASAAQQAAQAAREGARAYNAASEGAHRHQQATEAATRASRQDTQERQLGTRSLQAMGREIVRLEDQRRTLMQIQERNGQLSARESAALQVTNQRLGQVNRSVGQLNESQRDQVRLGSELARAQQTTSSGMASMTRYSREMVTATRDQNRAMNESTRMAADFNGSLWSMRSAVQDVGSSMQQLWMTSQRVTSALWENFSAQEMTIAQISRVSQATTTEMDAITSSVRQMSTEIPIAFDELGRITMLGSQVGVANEALGTFTETVALFSATSEVSADQTATLMARIMEMTNLNQTHGQESVQNLGSAVAYLGSNMVATDQEILTTIESIATMTTQAGMSADATIGLGAAMASLRIRPEIARGATQRVFLQLSQAIDGTSGEMQRLTEITGMSQQELQGLRDDNFDAYFMTIMESLNGAYEAGSDLVPMLREIGILNSRDAEVVARLAANYNVLESGMNGANSAFADGNYLYEESSRIFDTLTARLQILSNTWQNFLFAAVDAIGPFLAALIDTATAAIQFADSIGAAPVLGWSAVLLGAVGVVGLLASGISQLSVGMLAIRGLMNMLTGSTAAATASLTAQAGSTAAATASQTAYQGALMRTVTWGSATTTSVLATSTAMGVMATSARTAATSMAALALANPVFLVAGITAALVAASVQWGVFSDQTERARQSVLDANESHIMAAGGLDSLRSALERDTVAWQDARENATAYADDLSTTTNSLVSSGEDVIRNSRFRVQASQEMSEADREAAESSQQLSERQQWLRDELGITTESFSDAGSAASDMSDSASDLADSTGEAGESVGQANRAVSESTQAMEDSAFAVGLATRQWSALSLEAAVAESGLLENAEAFELVRESGADLGAALTMEMQEAGAGAEYLRSKAAEVRDEFGNWDSFLEGLNDFTDNMVWDGWRPFTTGASEAANALDDFAGNLDASTYSIEEAARETELLQGAFIELPDGTRASADALAEMGAEGSQTAAVATLLETEVDSLGTSIDVLRDGFSSFISPLQTWKDTLSDAGLDADAFSVSLDGLEGGFSSYLDNLEETQAAQMEWGQNLLELAGTVPPEVIAGIAEMGVEGASLVNELVNATDEEVDRFVNVWEGGTSAAADEFAVMFSDFLSMAEESGDQGGVDFVNNLMDQVARGEIEFSDAVDQMTTYAQDEFEASDPTAEAHLESTQAMIDLTEAINGMREAAEAANPTATARAETSGAQRTLADFAAWVAARPITQWVITRTQTSRGHGRVPKYQDGGWIEGSGGPRQDNIPIMASAGEFVVNARAASMFGDELEQMNAMGRGLSTTASVPNFVPDDIMELPQPNLSGVQMLMPPGLEAAMRTNSIASGPRMVINVYNTYPQAEPTSISVNRSLAYAATLDPVI